MNVSEAQKKILHNLSAAVELFPLVEKDRADDKIVATAILAGRQDLCDWWRPGEMLPMLIVPAIKAVKLPHIDREALVASTDELLTAFKLHLRRAPV